MGDADSESQQILADQIWISRVLSMVEQFAAMWATHA